MYNIKYFKLRCYNQNLTIIDDMPDYYMTLQFNIKKKDNTEQLLKLILRPKPSVICPSSKTCKRALKMSG